MQQQAFALYQCRVSPAATRDYLYSYDPTKPDIPVNQPLSHAEVQEFQRLRETFLQQGGTLPSHDFHDWVMPEQCAPELIEQLVNYSVRTDYHQRPFSYPLTFWDCCILRYLVHHFIRTKLFQLTTNEDEEAIYHRTTTLIFPSPQAAIYVLSLDEKLDARDALHLEGQNQTLREVLQQQRPN
jgi:hypothetical protein